MVGKGMIGKGMNRPVLCIAIMVYPCFCVVIAEKTLECGWLCGLFG